MFRTAAALTLVSASTAANAQYIQLFGDGPGMMPAPRIDYFLSDRGDAKNLEVDVTGDGVFDIAMQIFSDDGETTLGLLDFTRSGGFLGAFDDNFHFIIDTFEIGDEIGDADEDRVGFETVALTASRFDGLPDFDSLIDSTFWVGFGLFDSDEDRFRYGFLNLTIGGLELPTFMQINAIVYGNDVDENLVLRIPSPATLALLPASLAFAPRRR